MRILVHVSISPEELAVLVPNALRSVPLSRASSPGSDLASIPVRPPRPRNLARQLLEGDALKADAKRFLSRRKSALPEDWTLEGILTVEQALAAVGVPGGTFLGLLRFSADLQADRLQGRTWIETRWWGYLRRRLTTSAGVAFVRAVADGLDEVRHLVEDADYHDRQGFTDLLRVLGVRTGVDIIAHPRLAEKPLWEYAILLAARVRRWNRTHSGTHRRVVPLDFHLGGTMVFLRDRQAEPTLLDLRTAVFQHGAPLAPALDAWLRRSQELSGSSLLKITIPSGADPREWVWSAGQALIQDARPERLARLAACERGLIDLVRREEAAREQAAQAVEHSLRELLERELPASRLLEAPIPKAPPVASEAVPAPRSRAATESVVPATVMAPFDSLQLPEMDLEPESRPTVRLPPRPAPVANPPRVGAKPVPATLESGSEKAVPEPPRPPVSDPLALAMADYETSTQLRVMGPPSGEGEQPELVQLLDSAPLDALPVGFDLVDLERQASQLEECLRTGFTPTGRQWVEQFRGLLADARVREFLRFPSDWIGGLRDLLTSGDTWILAGMEDLIRYIYPRASRSMDLEFRYHQRQGDPSPSRTGWDWTVLRLICLAVAETASRQGDPEFAPTPLVTLRRWQSFSRARDLPTHTQGWWSWLAEEVDVRSESAHSHSFEVRSAAELSLWRERYVKPWLAIPSDSNLSKLGPWARMPLHHLRQDPQPSAERWASRLAMLGQLLEEAKEDMLQELSTGPI